MRVPKQELPDIETIRDLAGRNLPPHCRLTDVRCEFGSLALPGVPADFQIVIEYENLLERPYRGGGEEAEALQAWVEPLIARIRAEWPPSTVRILLHESVAAID